MARLALQRLADIEHGANRIAHQVERIGALVPGLGPVRLQADDAIEQPDRELVLLVLERLLGTGHQQIGRVGTRTGPAPLDQPRDASASSCVAASCRRWNSRSSVAAGLRCAVLGVTGLSALSSGATVPGPQRRHGLGKGRARHKRTGQSQQQRDSNGRDARADHARNSSRSSRIVKSQPGERATQKERARHRRPALQNPNRGNRAAEAARRLSPDAP